MAYDYQTQKKELLTDEGQKQFLQVRELVQKMIAETGALTAEVLINRHTRNRGVADPWFVFACVDRMIELKEIREVPQVDIAGQHRVYAAKF